VAEAKNTSQLTGGEDGDLDDFTARDAVVTSSGRRRPKSREAEFGDLKGKVRPRPRLVEADDQR